MSESKPDPKPAAGGPEIPIGKLVGGRPEKPAASRAKPRLAELVPSAPVLPPPVPSPIPAPPVASPPMAGGFDVELVAIPFAPPKPVKPRDQRSLFQLDRRDFIMLGTGAGATVAAVLVGLVAAKALQTKPIEEKPAEPDSKAK